MSDLIRELMGASHDIGRGLDMAGELVGMKKNKDGEFKRSDNVTFESDIMIRTQVFKTEGEATMADMSTEAGVKYMEAVNLVRNAFGG